MSTRQTFDEIRQRLAAGSTTVEQLTENCLQAIEKGKHYNAFLSLFTERALAKAREVDRKLQRAGEAGATGLPEGARPGRLAGMVVAIKDVICVKGERVTCASKILEHYVSPYDATVIRRLEAEDAVLIGKTNLDEFAMGSSTENSAFGPVLNPLDESRVPGGSSGGSCVAVAAGMAHTALGTDTGGSIRQPASFCGVVGLKPTYGRVSRYGLVALSSSFDQIGPFANSTRDAAHLLQVIAGHDPLDSTSVDAPVPDYLSSLTGDIRGVKIGLPHEVFGEGLNREVKEAVERTAERLGAEGAEVVRISLPHADYNIAAYYILMTAEASSNLARYDGVRYGHRSHEAHDLLEMYVRSRSEGFGPETKRRIMLGTYALSAGYYDAYYRKAQQVRRLIQNDFLKAFTKVDCVIMPTSPTTAFRFGEKSTPLEMYLSDIYTVSANLAGLPAISVPCGNDSQGLPIGIQVLAAQFDEPMVLRVGDVIEKNNGLPQSSLHSHEHPC